MHHNNNLLKPFFTKSHFKVIISSTSYSGVQYSISELAQKLPRQTIFSLITSCSLWTKLKSKLVLWWINFFDYEAALDRGLVCTNYKNKVPKNTNEELQKTQRLLVSVMASNILFSSSDSSIHCELSRPNNSFFSFFFSSCFFIVLLQCSSFSALSFNCLQIN